MIELPRHNNINKNYAAAANKTRITTTSSFGKLYFRATTISLLLLLSLIKTSQSSFITFPNNNNNNIMTITTTTKKSTTTPRHHSHQVTTTLHQTSQQQQQQQHSSSSTINVVETTQLTLSNGITAQIISRHHPPPTTSSPQQQPQFPPPLIFIHGSFHAAWCWSDHYLPYFSSQGYDSVWALSLRGTDGTPPLDDGRRSVRIDEHVDDVSCFVRHVLDETGRAPIVVGHSFGGVVVMKYLERLADELLATDNDDGGGRHFKDVIAGVGLLCSVPPSGNSQMTMRFLRRSLVDSWKVTSGLAMKNCITNVDLCRTLFFDSVETGGVTDEDIKRIQSYFERDSRVTIDIRDFVKRVPSKRAVDGGRASFLSLLEGVKVLVVGAERDFIVDRVGVEETAYFLGVEPIFVDSPHDIMLGNTWHECANVILKWIQEETDVDVESQTTSTLQS